MQGGAPWKTLTARGFLGARKGAVGVAAGRGGGDGGHGGGAAEGRGPSQVLVEEEDHPVGTGFWPQQRLPKGRVHPTQVRVPQGGGRDGRGVHPRQVHGWPAGQEAGGLLPRSARFAAGQRRVCQVRLVEGLRRGAVCAVAAWSLCPSRGKQLLEEGKKNSGLKFQDDKRVTLRCTTGRF